MNRIVCEKCQKQFGARSGLAGRKVRCGRCGHVFVVPHGLPGNAGSKAAYLAPAESTKDKRLPPPVPVSHVKSFLGLVWTVIRLSLLAAILSFLGGAVGDLLTPVARINLTITAISGGIALLLLVVCLIRPSRRLSLASFFFLLLGAGFGGWWGLTELQGGKTSGFLAEHVRFVSDYQPSVLEFIKPTRLANKDTISEDKEPDSQKDIRAEGENAPLPGGDKPIQQKAPEEKRDKPDALLPDKPLGDKPIQRQIPEKKKGNPDTPQPDNLLGKEVEKGEALGESDTRQPPAKGDHDPNKKRRPDGKGSDPTLSRVMAEGTGTTPDEALKEAFRDAVRQVVGAVVDADTLIKNDQIISDKVLVYSDGFIKTYDKVSQKHDQGIFRVRIQAQVERRSVITRLVAAKITVKDVDGKGLFAEAITNLEAAQNAKELLERAIDGFPEKILEAQIIGKPQLLKYDETTGTINLAVQVTANPKVYLDFVTKLQNTLKRIAKNGGEFFMTAQVADKGSVPNTTSRWFRVSSALRDADSISTGRLWRTQIKGVYKNDEAELRGSVAIAVCTGWRRTNDGTQWEYYVVDQSVMGLLSAKSLHKLAVKVLLLSENEKVIAVDTFPFNYSHGRLILPHQSLIIPSWGFADAGKSLRRENDSLFIISPLFIYPSDMGYIHYNPTFERRRQVSLTLEEVKAVHHVKCELFSEGR